MAKQVLVIDDNRDTVEFLSAVLSEEGYEPIPAYDGNEGLRKVEQIEPEMFVDKPVDTYSFIAKVRQLIG